MPSIQLQTHSVCRLPSSATTLPSSPDGLDAARSYSNSSWSASASSSNTPRPITLRPCGKVERFHQTLKRFLRKQPSASSMAELQFQLDAFRDYYNNRRPHRALNRQTPMAVFNALIKAKPSQQTPPIDHRVRHDKIDSSGKVTLRYLGKLRHIPVGVAHKNRKVRLLVAGPDVRIITNDGELIRALTLDPNRNYQPLSGRWPVHNVLQQVSTMS